MNRRHFLQSGSLAVLAAAGLPRAVRGMKTQVPTSSVYRSKPDPGKTGQWLYEVTIFHNGFEHLEQSTAAEKVVSIKSAYFATDDFKKPTKEGVSQYIIKEATERAELTSTYVITTRFDKKISGEKLGKEFGKTLKMRCAEDEYLDILNKDGDTLYSLPFPSESGDSEGCFLTTACVQHHQLPDDCDELQTLRLLRDKYMTASSDGIEMIKQYRTIGPDIVQAINKCSNKKDIYEYMYSNMILPSVQLVKEGRNEEAVEYYKVFVKELMEKYN